MHYVGVKKVVNRLVVVAAAFVLSVGMVSLLSACGGDGSSAGNSVEGNVATFAGNNAFFMPEQPQTLLGRAVNMVWGALVPEARANVAGVVVTVVGTDIQKTTDGSGFFKIEDVPPGPQVLEFTFNGITGTLNITVPEKGEVIITNIEVDSGGGVDVENVIVLEDDGSSDDVSDEDSTDDDSGDDDDSVDDDSGDDEDDDSID